jgi:hypothetical protein
MVREALAIRRESGQVYGYAGTARNASGNGCGIEPIKATDV